MTDVTHDILIVDDENDIRLLTAGVLVDEGYTTREAPGAEEALRLIDQSRPSLIVLDVWLQGSKIDGIELLGIIKAQYPDIPVVIMSGHGNIESAVMAIKQGAYDYIEKPFKSDRLILLAARAIEAAQLRRENLELRMRADDPDMIGSSPAMRMVRSAINKVAPTASRVLITGPAGVGKELVARAIHGESQRAGGPFVAVNCASMHPDRLETELFGAEGIDGTDRHLGVFENANKGTLFLDEVGDMPLETQGKIVRVLQEQTFERVGGSVLIEVDVRVVAATSRDLESEIANARFREDLYYRLAVVPIAVPPLKDRREDIPELIKYFMSRSAQTSGLAARSLGNDALGALQSHDWPGNVRQLRNVVERLLIMAPSNEEGPIKADMLPPEIVGVGPATPGRDGREQLMGLDLRAAREKFEREYLEAQIDRFGGNVSKTAEFIGMERTALHRKIKMLGIVVENSGRERSGA
ncbi:MAG: sigma-54-dependent Fis family transcriptional regulator [Rhodospirillales bacterium]|jgi:two-component system, NtrC family, nitrogen regulation response regulator NtrX|nr:sigma-54-dependent Fis family transcriptional regulator [Rhodospirillales bacterium]MBT4006032.1 sigma-54-dependent Fis family transcriptional regulator [Rhodospirillales bacterium]MBT5112775.1 sigma-54-dependent Fis family transcriptional regulator [Rhodospirillales bacterium]MBT5673545.1 sigma-54-dependent Fis family transcriptional regulator [Rhodospirillales bacterium]MBT6186204.1 sigma-54-dependent Fis family transcriptional regulator [Rhodospirillales bacterium]